MNTYKYGLFAGLSMLLIMSLMSISGNYDIGIIKFIKYIALGIFLFSAAVNLKYKELKNNFFSMMLGNGLKISFIAGIFLTIGTVLLYLIDPIYAPMKFGIIPDSIGQAATVGFMLLVESIVFGGIMNFIIFQMLKPGSENIKA